MASKVIFSNKGRSAQNIVFSSVFPPLNTLIYLLITFDFPPILLIVPPLNAIGAPSRPCECLELGVIFQVAIMRFFLYSFPSASHLFLCPYLKAGPRLSLSPGIDPGVGTYFESLVLSSYICFGVHFVRSRVRQ